MNHDNANADPVDLPVSPDPDRRGHPLNSDEANDAARTLFTRAATDTAMLDERTRTRRARLLSHAERSSARRQALAELLRSGALADAVAVDPLLRRDVMRLVAFVRGDHPPG